MKPEPRRHVIDISSAALFKVLGLGVAIWLVMNLRDIILMLFGVFLFVAMVAPTITKLQRYMSRFLAVLLFYAFMLIVVGILAAVVVPNLLVQINVLARAFPSIASQATDLFHSSQFQPYLPVVTKVLESISTALSNFSNDFLDTTISFASNIAIVVTGVVISFYLLLEEKNAREFLHQVLPPGRFEPMYNTVGKISERMGSWGRGQLMLMLIIGTSNLIGFFLIHLASPLPLGIWAGACEVLPYVGPFLGVIPALIVAITTGSVVQVLLVLFISIVVVQQIEAHIVVPKIMGKAIGLSPVLVILSLLIGAHLFGFSGAILAVPIAAVTSVVVGEWPQLRTMWEVSEREVS
jgi:predicted PurR-regulated permease PerM